MWSREQCGLVAPTDTPTRPAYAAPGLSQLPQPFGASLLRDSILPHYSTSHHSSLTTPKVHGRVCAYTHLRT